jgi:hypothetical protein
MFSIISVAWKYKVECKVTPALDDAHSKSLKYNAVYVYIYKITECSLCLTVHFLNNANE